MLLMSLAYLMTVHCPPPSGLLYTVGYSAVAEAAATDAAIDDDDDDGLSAVGFTAGCTVVHALCNIYLSNTVHHAQLASLWPVVLTLTAAL